MTSAIVGCTGTNLEYAVRGVSFVVAPADGSEAAKTVAATISGNYFEAEVAGLRPSTQYTVHAVATAADGTQYRSAAGSFTTAAEALTTHSGWLELPAKGGVATASEMTMTAGERNYTMYYDKSTYSALWVAYPLAKGHVGTLSRPSSWSATPGMAQSDQINVWSGSYGVNVGSTIYARGHQIPNGDRNGNSAMQLQTFYATNSTPQIQNTFNASIWGALEDAVRAEAMKTDTVFVATGPVYRTVGGSESVKTITLQHDTSKRCPVPNYYYKAVLKVKRTNGRVTAASAVGFWFEHKEYPSGSSYASYAVSVDEIERRTGFDLFANLPDDIEASAEANTSWTAFQKF
ncbi:MAG: DNA/RNA non-specific endonuclease [Alistipes sp.]|nr:DNA/RNA non-specific endonuclease [Alistipes sp.]